MIYISNASVLMVKFVKKAKINYNEHLESCVIVYWFAYW